MYQYNMGYLDPFYNEEEEKKNIEKISKKMVNGLETIKNDTIVLKNYILDLLIS